MIHKLDADGKGLLLPSYVQETGPRNGPVPVVSSQTAEQPLTNRRNICLVCMGLKSQQAETSRSITLAKK